MRLLLTGGGTAGHVMPHLAMLPFYRAKGFKLAYIGSAGIERELVIAAGLTYFQITVGKLRRYISLQNLLDIFRVVRGILQALQVLRQWRPDLVFAKGGYVSVPVAIAAWLLRIPVISHESDLSPGLANRIIARFASQILTSFPETQALLGGKAKLVGIPIRSELNSGDRLAGLAHCGFNVASKKPILLVMGGSLGALRINLSLAEILPSLVKDYRVVHLTGKGKGVDFHDADYKAFSFLGAELKDVFACTDLVLSRAGANAIFELKALRKPMLLIPLEQGSRGDQVENAASFNAQGWALVLREAELNASTLRASIDSLALAQSSLLGRLSAESLPDPAEAIMQRLAEYQINSPH